MGELASIRALPEENGTVTVIVSGEIDNSNAGTLGEALAAALALSPARLQVDLAGITYLGSAAIQQLVNTREQAGPIPLEVVSPSPIVLRVLTLAGLDGMVRREASAQ